MTDDARQRWELAAAEERYRTLVERIPDVIWTCTKDVGITFVTPNVESLLGYTPAEFCAQARNAAAAAIHPDDRDSVCRAFERFANAGVSFDIEYRRLTKDGAWIWVRNRAMAAYEKDGVHYTEGLLSDVSERKRLEDILLQSQKMEAIGELTGGIAHDFNNILAAILAHSHFLIEDLAENDPRRADAKQIQQAAERAAALTRQLLAFSRRQVLQTTVVDLNFSLASVEKMLLRLVGEDIDFAVAPGADLGAVRVDVGQLEQVVVNLVVNARDAMPDGGTMLLETANVDFDEEAAAAHGAPTPGRYVMLAVSDSGCGMDAETKRRMFEPFFTTKKQGKGTGLGLSTSYGIVKQSGGFIWVYSETGRGTVFKVYLPRVDERPTEARVQAARGTLHGSETILLAEDEPLVREAVQRMLETHGYRVLVARDGLEAVAIARAHEGPLDLVLSDVVMPRSNGPDLVRAVKELFPRAKALLMSGYTDHAALRGGLLEAELDFIQKPFAPASLARKLREVLDA